ncbi:hypothetical protein GCM10010442_51490 [Kitasatospora kifunensis]
MVGFRTLPAGAAAGADSSNLHSNGRPGLRIYGATHIAVACLGAPGHHRARGLYYGLGFRELSRDAPLINTRTMG